MRQVGSLGLAAGAGEEEEEQRGRGRDESPSAQRLPPVSHRRGGDAPHEVFRDRPEGLDLPPAGKPPPRRGNPRLDPARPAEEEVAGLAPAAAAAALPHGLLPANRALSFLRARWMRTRTPVTVIPKRRAISLSASPSTSRARRSS